MEPSIDEIEAVFIIGKFEEALRKCEAELRALEALKVRYTAKNCLGIDIF
jgi:hypothetical protein